MGIQIVCGLLEYLKSHHLHHFVVSYMYIYRVICY